jgi:hypothetical protein
MASQCVGVAVVLLTTGEWLTLFSVGHLARYCNQRVVVLPGGASEEDTRCLIVVSGYTLP